MNEDVFPIGKMCISSQPMVVELEGKFLFAPTKEPQGANLREYWGHNFVCGESN